MKREDAETTIIALVMIAVATMFCMQIDKVRNLEKDMQFIERQQQEAEKELKEYRQEAQNIIDKVLSKEW